MDEGTGRAAPEPVVLSGSTTANRPSTRSA